MEPCLQSGVRGGPPPPLLACWEMGPQVLPPLNFPLSFVLHCRLTGVSARAWCVLDGQVAARACSVGHTLVFSWSHFTVAVVTQSGASTPSTLLFHM